MAMVVRSQFNQTDEPNQIVVFDQTDSNKNQQIVPLDPFEPLQPISVTPSSPQQSVIPASTISDFTSHFNFSNPAPQQIESSPKKSFDKNNIPKSHQQKWNNANFLKTLEAFVDDDKDASQIPLVVNVWETEGAMNFIRDFVRFCQNILRAIKTESNEYENLTAENITMHIPEFIKDAVKSHKSELPTLSFLTQKSNQEEFWEWVGEPHTRKATSRKKTFDFIAGFNDQQPLTDTSNISTFEFLWNKLKYEVLLVNILFEHDANKLILPFYYKELKKDIEEVFNTYKIGYSIEITEKSKNQALSDFDKYVNKLKDKAKTIIKENRIVQIVNNVLALWPFGAKELKSSENFDWMDLQELVFKNQIDNIDFKYKPNHIIYNAILDILKKSKPSKSDLYQKLLDSVDFNLIGAMLKFKTSDQNLNNLIRYTMINQNQLTFSNSFLDFYSSENKSDVNQRIIKLSENPNKELIFNQTNAVFEPDWWSKTASTKFANQSTKILKDMIDKFRKEGGPDALMLINVSFESFKNDEKAYLYESLRTLNFLLQNEAFVEKIRTFHDIIKQKFPQQFIDNELYDFKVYTQKDQRFDLTYPFSPSIQEMMITLPPLIVRYEIGEELKLFHQLNSLFDDKLRNNSSPEINFEEFWIYKKPFPNITVFRYVHRGQLSATPSDLKSIGGVNFNVTDLNQVYEYESVIRMNLNDQPNEITNRKLDKFLQPSNFEDSEFEKWLQLINKDRPLLTENLELLFDKFLFDLSANMSDRVQFLQRVGASPFVIQVALSVGANNTITSVLNVPLDSQPQLQPQPQQTTQPTLLVFDSSTSTASEFMRKKSRRGRTSTRRRTIPKRRVPRRKPRVIKRRSLKSRKSRQNI